MKISLVLASIHYRHVRFKNILLYNVKHISDLKLGLNITASFSCEVNHSVIKIFLLIMNYFVNTCIWSHSLICSQVGSHPLRRMDNPRPKILFLYTLWSSSSNLLSSLFIAGTRGDINATTGVKYLGWCKASTLLLVSNTAGGLCIKDDENTCSSG